MLTPAIDAYLAIRRSAGFGLRVTEGFLRNYARFATARGNTHIREQTALEWAALAPSVSQRGRRLEAITVSPFHLHRSPNPSAFGASRMLATLRLLAAVDLLHAILLAGSDGDANFGGTGTALRGYHR
jgi:integrase/recombinase XerD